MRPFSFLKACHTTSVVISKAFPPLCVLQCALINRSYTALKLLAQSESYNGVRSLVTLSKKHIPSLLCIVKNSQLSFSIDGGGVCITSEAASRGALKEQCVPQLRLCSTCNLWSFGRDPVTEGV